MGISVIAHAHSAIAALGPTASSALAAAAPYAPCSESDGAGLERTRFYQRQLVTPDDLTQDQIYFREKSKRHNRMLHGWGVVCGTCVRLGRTPCEIVVDPGYVLGPFGDEIIIPKAVSLDLCKHGLAERIGCCGDDVDPWCADARRDCPEGTVYLAVRYDECRTRPVHATACGCGCEDGACEHTRIRDGYVLKLLAELPSTYTTPMRPPAMADLLPCGRTGTMRRCPPCPTDPWVILADVSLGRDCRVQSIDCFAHRRYVASFATFFFLCAPRPGVTIAPARVTPGAIGTARLYAMMAGGTDLVDISAAMSAEPPRATVTMRRTDGTPVVVPAHFTVEPGVSLADLIEREGDREFYDPMTDDTIRLRELFAAAGATPATEVGSATGALALLEDRALDITAIRTGRARLETVLDRSGLDRLDRDFLGAPTRAADLPITTLTTVGTTSSLGRRLARTTIGEVAGMDREAFIAKALEGASPRQRKELEKQATEAWEGAQRALGRNPLR